MSTEDRAIEALYELYTIDAIYTCRDADTICTHCVNKNWEELLTLVDGLLGHNVSLDPVTHK